MSFKEPAPLNLPPALRYPSYRAYWLGSVASISGFQMLRFGQFWLIYEITGSALSLGYIGLANGIPAVALNLVGGVAADKVDQRRLIVVTQLVIAALAFLLATITLMDLLEVWHLLAIAFFSGAVEAFDQPARRSIFPHLVERKDMMSAVAMNSSIWPGTRIAAPAIAGLIIAQAGTAVSFYVSGAGFVAMAMVMYSLRIPHITRSTGRNAVSDVKEGLQFIKGNSSFMFLMGLTFFHSLFGTTYIMLMPIFAVDILEVGADGQGLLLGVGAVGSLGTALWLATRRNDAPRAWLIIVGCVMSGLSLAAFALTSEYVGSFALAMVMMFVLGVFTTGFTTGTQTSLQMMVPDQFRGRVMGFYGMTFNIRPLGGVQASALASIGALGAPFALAIGGAAVVVYTIVSVALKRDLRSLDAQGPQASDTAASGAGAQQSAASSETRPR